MHTPGGGGYGSRDGTKTMSGLTEGMEKDIATSAGYPRSFETGNSMSVGGNKTFVERGSVFEYRQAQESV